MMFPQDWWYSLNNDLFKAYQSFYIILKSRTSAHVHQINDSACFQKEMLTSIHIHDINCLLSKIIEQLYWIWKKILKLIVSLGIVHLRWHSDWLLSRYSVMTSRCNLLKIDSMLYDMKRLYSSLSSFQFCHWAISFLFFLRMLKKYFLAGLKFFKCAHEITHCIPLA